MARISWRRLRKGLRGVPGRILHGYPLAFNPDKRELLDRAFRDLPAGQRSFADLGGVWGIGAAYTFYLMDHHRPTRGVLVDTNFTPAVRDRSQRHPALELIHANFGDAAVPERVGPVGFVMFFDVLLHQVRPDWDEVLRRYAPITRRFVIFNQQFIAGDRTVRLVDLGMEEYFRHVRFDPALPGYRELRETPDEINPEYGRTYRDVHNVWQWGITDADLIARLSALGYRLTYHKNHGRFGDFPSFENHAFIFDRD